MRWDRLLLFCSGLSLAAAFIMKWIEPDLLYQNQPVSILDLEIFYPSGQLLSVLTGMDEKVKLILKYHLEFDFVFMAGIFPGIASLCMMAAEKHKAKRVQWLLFVLAALQPAAWLFDITENWFLLHWLWHPVIGREFGIYRMVVYSKWLIALTGLFTALFIFLASYIRKKSK